MALAKLAHVRGQLESSQDRLVEHAADRQDMLNAPIHHMNQQQADPGQADIAGHRMHRELLAEHGALEQIQVGHEVRKEHRRRLVEDGE